MTCTLYGQVDIELSGTKEIEVVLEGELNAIQLKGQLDIALDSMQNIYLGGIINDPKLEAGLGLILNLEACITTENDYVNAVAKGCCPENEAIVVQVLSSNVPTLLTHGFIYNEICYQFSGIGSGNPAITTILPEQYIVDPCNYSLCPSCLTPTPTPTPTITPSVVYNIHRFASCCNNPTEFNYYASIPSNWLVGNTIITDDGQCYVIGAQSIGTININPVSYNPFGCEDCISVNPCTTNTPTPSVTNTLTPTLTPSNTTTPTITPTPTTSVSYTNWGAKECCNEDLIIVQVLTNNQPTALTDGFIYNGDCYLFSGPGGSNPVTTILPENYNNDPCNNPSCPSCPSPTPTPSPTTPCSTCNEYTVTNNDNVQNLVINFVRCNDGATLGQTILPKQSSTICSCSSPVRVSGTLNWTLINNGPCGVTPTPTPTITPSVTPSSPRGPEGCYAHVVKNDLTDTTVCDGTATTNTYYFPYQNDFRAGDMAYTNSSCTSTANAGRYIEDKYNSEPSGYIFEILSGGILSPYLCT